MMTESAIERVQNAIKITTTLAINSGNIPVTENEYVLVINRSLTTSDVNKQIGTNSIHSLNQPGILRFRKKDSGIKRGSNATKKTQYN